jgi:hypothetical protein
MLMKVAALSALMLLVCLPASAAPEQASWSGTVTLNFDSIAGAGCVDATSYLASFGVTVTEQSSGTVVSTGSAGQCFHGDVVVPSAPRALYVQNNRPVRFSLNFDRPLISVSFVRARLNAGPNGVNTVGWTATAYTAAGTEIDSVGEDARTAYSPNFIAPASFTLTGAGIRSVNFVRTNPRADNASFGVSFAVLDDLVLTEGAARLAPPAPFAARGWPVVDGPNRVFSLAMPMAPIYRLQSGIHIYFAAEGGAEYTAQTTTLAADAVADPRANLERGVTGTASSLRSKAWTTTDWTTFQGAPAVEVTGITAAGLDVRMLMILKGRQYYVLGYSGPRGTTRSPDAERFFNSLRIQP